MNKVLSFLDGKKTFIIAGATIIYSILGIYLGYMNVPAALSVMGTSGSLAALRLGLAKLETVLEIIVQVLQAINQAKPAEVPPVVPTPPAPVTV